MKTGRVQTGVAEDMFVELELSRSMSILASLATSELSGDERRSAVSAAKAHVARYAGLVAFAE